MARTPLFANNQPGGMFTITDVPQHPGNVFFVDSGHDNAEDALGGGGSPDTPLATLDYAVGLCTANNGDVIYVMPGHAETIATAAALDINVAGIKVIGLGWGATRPTFSLSAAASTVAIGASSVWIENMIFAATFTDGVVVGLDIDDAHTDVMVKNCEFRDTLATKEFLTTVTIAADAQRVTFDGCEFRGLAGSGTSCIITEGACTDLTVHGCLFHGTWTTAVITLTAGTNVVVTPRIINNVAYNSDTSAGLFCALDSGTIGLFVGNRTGIGKANTVPVTDTSASVMIDNLATDAANVSELKYPATATAWS